MILYKSELNKALKTISSAIDNNSLALSMTGALVDIDNQTITGYNMEIAITKGITIVKDFNDTVNKFIIPPRLIELIPKFDNEEINISISNNILSVKNGNYKGTIQSMAASDFAELPELKTDTEPVTIDFIEFQTLIENVTYTINELNPHISISGMLIEIKNNELVCVGCDGCRLSLSKCTFNHENIKVIIPKKVAVIIKNLHLNGKLSIAVTLNHISFVIENIQVTSRIISGEYLDYHQAIPTTNNKTIHIKVAALKRIIERFNILVNYSKNRKTPLELIITENLINLKGKSPDGEFTEHLDTKTQGITETFHIGVNPHYLLEMLMHTISDDVELSLDTPLTPIVCKNVIEVEHYCISIILPIRIRTT